MSNNPAVDDIMALFDFKVADNSGNSESDDYVPSASVDSSRKPSFDEIALEMGDKIVSLNPDAIPSVGTFVPKEEVKEEKEDNSKSARDIMDGLKGISVDPIVAAVDKAILESLVNAVNDANDANDANDPKEVVVDDLFAENLIKSSISEVVVKNEFMVEADEIGDIFSNSNEGKNKENVEINNIGNTTVPMETAEVVPPAEPEIAHEEHENKLVEPIVIEMPRRVEEKQMMTKNEIFKWHLDAPNDKFVSFYSRKRQELNHLLPGGELNFDGLTKELKSAHVDLNLVVLDPIEVNKQIVEVIHWRNRVSQIQVDVNNQYFRFRRFVDLFRGVLARVEYEKPALRQDGLVFEHLRDFELYLSKLEALYESSKHIAITLEAAHEALSRQLTIALGDKRGDSGTRYEKPMHKNAPVAYSHVPKKQSDEESSNIKQQYDRIETGTSASSKPKSGSIGWGEVTR